MSVPTNYVRLKKSMEVCLGHRLSMASNGTLSSLRPVILANGDFDEEITPLKEVVASEFTKTVNVSNMTTINVTKDNVDELCNNILTPETQFSTFQGAQANQAVQNPTEPGAQCPYDTQLSSIQNQERQSSDPVRSLPRDIFLTQIFKDSPSDRDRLEAVKLELFGIIQNSDGYPYDSRANLKKRIKTRTGDVVENKLANDIHCFFVFSTLLIGTI